MRLTWLPLIFYLILAFYIENVTCQNFLQVEKINSLKILKYSLGSDLVFRTQDGGTDWYTRTVTDIDRELGMVFLDNMAIPLSEITHIKSFKNRAWSKGIAQSMRISGLSWVVYNAIDDIFYNSGDWETTAYVVSSSFVLSVPIELLFKSKTHRVKSTYRLRLMDVSF